MKTILTEVTRPMERGQITIPIKIREELKITPQTWLWVKLITGGKVLLEPIKETAWRLLFEFQPTASYS